MRARAYGTLLLAVALVGCGGAPLGTDQGSCTGLSEADCLTRADCVPAGCPSCDGKSGFQFCALKGKDVPLACPAIACASCAGLSQEACALEPACAVGTCSGCKGESSFAGCYQAGTSPPPCPGLACPAPCDALDAQACDARSDCHPVFSDPGTCGCASVGCCMVFDHCADGAQADCKGPAKCASPEPLCEGQYVLGYTATCFEGCVRASDCAL